MDRYTDSPAFREALDAWITRGPADDEGDDDRHPYDRTCGCPNCLACADCDGDA